MKKIIFALLLGAVVYANLHQQKPAVVAIAPKHSEVILYATTWCGYCKKTRALLKTHHVQYTEYDVEKSAIGRLQHEQHEMKGVPVLDVKGLIVGGYDEDEILGALKAMKVI